MDMAVGTIVESRRDEIAALCTRFAVRRLDVFGSAVSGRFDPEHSDLDFMVEFDPTSCMTPFQQYFGLKEALEAMFNRPVDLVMAGASENPHFLKSVERSRREVYAA